MLCFTKYMQDAINNDTATDLNFSLQFSLLFSLLGKECKAY